MENIAYTSALSPTGRLGRKKVAGEICTVDTMTTISTQLIALAKMVNGMATNQTLNAVKVARPRCNHYE